jgi:hypothetical protein
MTSTRHRELIADLVAERGAQTWHFRRELLKCIELHDNEGAVLVPRCVPDAYRIDGGLVTVWEVEVSHHMPEGKLRDYAMLWADLDASAVAELDLRTVDRFGVERVVDLVAVYCEALARRAG